MKATAANILASNFDYKRQSYGLYYDNNTETLTSADFHSRYDGNGLFGDGFRALFDKNDPWRISAITITR